MKKNSFRISLATLLICLLLPVSSYAQQYISVSGVVRDVNNEPLPSATVIIKGTTTGTLTDLDGRYNLSVPSNATLEFSYTGFRSAEIAVGNRSIINSVLEELFQDLDEVVVVGYGVQKKINLTGAVDAVKGEVVAKRASGQLSSMMQGLSPGVTVTQSSGQPGKDVGEIRIRGIGTINKASPLTIIDGIEGDINNIDPNMIESISVLKDAASSAIYGSRAANGVILVTTKRASEGGFKVTYNGYAGVQEATNLPKTVNAYEHMLYLNEAYENVGSTPLYSRDYLNTYRDSMGVSRNISMYPNTNWRKELLSGSGFQQNHFVTVAGSSGKLKIVTAAGYYNQKGIIANTDFKRYTFRINTDAEITSRLSSRVDAQMIHTNLLEPRTTMETIFRSIASFPASYVVRNTDGTWGEGWNGSNPVADAQEGGQNQQKITYLSLNVGLNYKIWEGLAADVVYSPSFTPGYLHEFSNQAQKYTATGQPIAKSISSLTETADRTFANTFKAMLTYDNQFGKHHVSALGGFQQEYSRYDLLKGYRDDFVTPEYEVLDAGATSNQRANGNAQDYSLQSWFGRVAYDYDSKYLFEANIRRDGTSRFTKSNRYGVFPSFSAGWRITEENFMENIKDVVTNLKLRGSWGILGNQALVNDYYPTSSMIAFGSSYVWGGTQYLGAAVTDLANKELKWEKTSMVDIGIDMQLFSKLNVTFDWYNKTTSDVLMKLSIPLTMGLAAPYQNAGKIRNKGWEIALNYNDRIGNDFRYDITLALSDVRNEVLDMKLTQTGLIVNKEGYPVHSLWGYQADGLFSSDAEAAGWATQFGDVKAGDIRYVNQNPDEDNIINSSDEMVIGNTIPRYTYSGIFNFGYKGFDLSMLWQGVGKRDGYINTYGIYPFYNGSTIQYQHLDRWTTENQNVNAAFPRFTFGHPNNEKNSTYWVKDASYLRLKNIQVGYTIPSKVAKKMSIERLRLNVSAQNLLTISRFWDGYDVEAPVTDGGFYPQVKTYTVGLDITF